MQLVVFVKLSFSSVVLGQEELMIRPTLELGNQSVKDQDDICVWRDSSNPSRSTIIASDKSANSLFVYDLTGQLLQQITIPKPGNLDLRQVVSIDGKSLDLVVVNQRSSGFRLCVFVIDAASRTLKRMDDDSLLTGPNYGGCLYHSRLTGRLFFISTSDKGIVEQHELVGDGSGGIRNSKVREWPLGKCESAVADDATGKLFISEEAKGVWMLNAEPLAGTPGELIIKVGENGLKGDVEGLAISDHSKLGKILVVSDQGRSRFMVYQRIEPYAYLGEFAIDGASDTDGIDLVELDLGPGFPHGLFACHTDKIPRPILVTPWHDILDKFLPLRGLGKAPN